MNKIICPYCETEYPNSGNVDTISCTKHHDVLVTLDIKSINSNNICQHIKLSQHKNKHLYEIYLYKDSEIMNIIVDFNIEINGSIDNAINPENFEQKLKTYLTFN
jgi:hypothetical protein